MPNTIRCITTIILGCMMIACQSTEPEVPALKAPVIHETKVGLASFYGKFFDGKKTASGDIFDHREMVAAHPKYPLGTLVRVTNLESQDTVHVTITDRGPTSTNQNEGVIIDVSRGAAKRLKMIEDGRIRVQVDVLKWGEENKSDASIDEIP